MRGSLRGPSSTEWGQRDLVTERLMWDTMKETGLTGKDSTTGAMGTTTGETSATDSDTGKATSRKAKLT